MHPPLPKDNANTVEKAIQKVKDDFLENLYVFRNGKQFLRFRGTENSVIPDEKYFIGVEDSIWVHNHPSGSSFSVEDIEMAIYSNISEFYIATENFKYVVKRPKGGWNLDFEKDEVNWLLNKCHSIAKQELDKLVVRNEISILERDKEIFHYIWSYFFQLNGIFYKKIEMQS